MDASLRQQTREPNALIGGRIRAARGLRSWSQERLGDELGVTFQQVQKYEKGLNRVSACTLLRISQLLNVDIGFFFPAGSAPIGRGELDAIRADVSASLAAIDVVIGALGAAIEEFGASKDRLSAIEKRLAAQTA